MALLLSRQLTRTPSRVPPTRSSCRLMVQHVQTRPVRRSHVPLKAAAADDTSEPSTSGALTEPQERQVWDSVSRALLRLGGAGITPSHIRSLQELVAAHTLVKVQLNGKVSPEEVQAVAQQLAEGSGAQVVQVKGRTVLFAASGTTGAQLLAWAKQQAAKTAAWRAKRKAAEQKRKEAIQATAEKRAMNTSRSSKKRASADNIIANVTGGAKGPLTKQGLKQEWASINEGLVAEEGGPEADARRRGSGPKQPWKREGSRVGSRRGGMSDGRGGSRGAGSSQRRQPRDEQ